MAMHTRMRRINMVLPSSHVGTNTWLSAFEPDWRKYIQTDKTNIRQARDTGANPFWQAKAQGPNVELFPVPSSTDCLQSQQVQNSVALVRSAGFRALCGARVHIVVLALGGANFCLLRRAKSQCPVQRSVFF